MNYELLLNAKSIYLVGFMFVLFIFGLLWSSDKFRDICIKLIYFLLGGWSSYELLIITKKINSESYLNMHMWILSMYFILWGLIWNRINVLNFIVKCSFFILGIIGIFISI